MSLNRRILLSDPVYLDLKWSIISGETRPGQLAHEADLAARYGTSETLVGIATLVAQIATTS